MIDEILIQYWLVGSYEIIYGRNCPYNTCLSEMRVNASTS